MLLSLRSAVRCPDLKTGHQHHVNDVVGIIRQINNSLAPRGLQRDEILMGNRIG